MTQPVGNPPNPPNLSEPTHTPRLIFASSDNRKSPLWLVFWRSACYEGKYLLHHSWDYLMLLWLPLLTIMGVWWIFSQPYINDLPIGVIDNSRSSYSQTLIRFLDASPDLEVRHQYQSPLLATEPATEQILSRDIYAVVIIPDDFADNINQGAPSPVILKVNAQYGTHSGIIQRGVQSVVGTFSAGVEIKRHIRQGQHTRQALVNYSPIGIERISLFNIGADYQQFLASTSIPALLHILVMIIGATTLGRELRDKTLSIWYHAIIHPDMPYPDFATLKHLPPQDKLNVIHSQLDASWQTPAHPTSNNGVGNGIGVGSDNGHALHHHTTKPRMPAQVSILALVVGLNGKLIWALVFYMLWGALMIMLAVSVHPTGWSEIAVTFVAFTALIMISLWLGAIFSLLTYSLRMGLSATAFISAPSFAFAGVTFPLMAMSENAQHWAQALPLTHYLKVHLAQLQMSAPISLVLPTVYGLIITVMVTLVITALLCIRAFKNPERWGAR